MIGTSQLINTFSRPCFTDTTDIFKDGSGVALYTLDYDASTSPDATNDYSGSPSNVTFGVGGQINYGARFNGSSSKITVSTSSTTPVDFTSENFSISLWFKADSLHSGALIGKWSTSDGTGRAILLHTNADGTFTFSERQGTSPFNLTTTSTYAANTWNHFVYVRNATQSILYLNNVSETDSRTNSINSGSTTELAIGYQTGGFKYFDGSIDQVRIFNRALTSGEVSKLNAETACVYDSTTDIVNYPTGTTSAAYYKLDNSSEDFSTGGNDGTDTNIEYEFGRFGQTAVFNGSSSKIVLPASTSVAQQNNYTFSAWFKTDTLGVMQTIYAFNSPSTYQSAIFIHSNGTNNIRIYSTGSNYYSSNNIYTNNQWYHIAVTKSSTNGLVVYLDGVVIINEPTATANNVQPAAGDNRIGGYKTSSESLWFDGSIDQVRIYSTALSSSQVTELYNEKPETDTSNFKTVLYEGTGSTQYISNVGMDLETDGGLAWLKSRDTGYHHRLFDSVRGLSTDGVLYSNLANAADNLPTANDNFVSFDANGFTLGATSSSDNGTNKSGDSFVAWVWKAGGDTVIGTGTGVTNVSISANTDAGFSIVKYTGGNSASDTVGHGLTDAEMIILKDLSDSTNNWRAWHKDLSANNWLYLNLSNAQASAATDGGIRNVDSNSFGFINGTTGGVEGVNSSASDYIAYCFHSVSGYSKIGSYSGSTTIVTENIGFKPSFVMIKRINEARDWIVFDTVRSNGDQMNDYLTPNSNLQEIVNSSIEINATSTGFTVASGLWVGINDNGGEYIYMAFK